MKTEKVVISFIAVVIGVLAAGVAFYLYQSTKTLPPKTQTISPPPVDKITPPPVLLSLDTPKDEDVVDTRTITVSGKTKPDAIVVITTATSDQVVTPAQNGNFSTTVVLENGPNMIEVTSIAQNGEETKVTRTVTVSTENF